MKKIHSTKTSKLIISAVIAIMLCNFVMPNFSFAETDTEDGGDLLNGVAEFLCFLPDAAIEFLQNMLVSPKELDEDGEYKIYYSPGAIFAGSVPAFDINFIDTSTIKESSWGKIESYSDFLAPLERSFF